MSIISAIYKAPVKAVAVSEINGEVVVLIDFNGKLYEGVATLHPEDEGFFSERVGKNIAKSRARLTIFQDAIAEAKKIDEVKGRMIKELATIIGCDWEKIDPTGLVYQNYIKSTLNLENLRYAYKQEKRKLNNYLEGQDRMVDSVKLHRRLEQEKQKDENN